MTAPEFFKQAECFGHDPELFFSDDHVKYAASHTAEAIKICKGCPVQYDCLTYALDRYEWGIWGGTTKYQRDQLRRKARAA